MVNHGESIKQVIRHVLYRTGGPRTLRLLKRARGTPTRHVGGGGGLEETFSTIFHHRVWSGDGSVSGPGSDPEATRSLPQALSDLLADLGVRRVTDIGCGDFGWMQQVDGDFDYCGIDIVADLIDGLSAQYGSPRRRFLHVDATRDPLPEGDVAICREVLFHLSFRDAASLIDNLMRHGYRYLIATSDTQVWFNSDIPSGDYRPVNLAMAPFRFPGPVSTIRDEAVAPGRILGAWKLDAVRPT